MNNPLQKLKLLAGLISCGLIGIFFANPISAANQTPTLTLSPAKADIKINKGETFKGSFRLYSSEGDEVLKVKLYPSAYQATNDDYKTETNSTHSQLHKWIKLDQQEVEIQPEGSVEINYSIETPDDLPDGGQYGLIFAEIINDSPQQATGVNAISRLGMPIFAATNGQDRLAGELFDAKIDAIQFNPTATFSFKAKNTGNTHANLNAALEIKDLFGNVKFSSEKKDVIIAPEIDGKKIQLDWNVTPIIGLMNVTLKGDFVDSKLEQTKLVLFISPIFLIVVVLIILIIGGTYVANKKFNYKFKK